MYELVQTLVFKKAAIAIAERLPEKNLYLEVPTEPVLSDLDEMNQLGLLTWIPRMVLPPFVTYEYHHPVRFVVYYSGKLVGYVFGGYHQERCVLEVHYLEKRRDAHVDLGKKFLPIAVETLAAYALFLKSEGLKVDNIAFVNPVSGLSKYYEDSGFSYVHNYDGFFSAMVFSRLNQGLPPTLMC